MGAARVDDARAVGYDRLVWFVCAIVASAWAVEPAQDPGASIPGRWYPNVYRAADTSALSPVEAAEVAKLEALGYADGYEPPTASGVVRWDVERAFAGTNLYSSGHAAQALLVGMDGAELHRWTKPFHEAFPGVAATSARDTGAWRRVALRPEDGHLLAIFEGVGLVHLDADSNIVWATANRAHHDVRWRPDGHVLVLTRILHAEHGQTPTFEDCVAELDADGRELRRVSVLAALSASPFRGLLTRLPPVPGDPLHTNALYPLDATTGPLGLGGPGRVLLSMRHLDAIAVLDLEEQRILWATSGDWVRQHDVELTPSGALQMFDNRGGPDSSSRVLVYDAATMHLRRVFAGTVTDGRVDHLRSEVLGAAQELPNGDLLVTESTRGRALEVTRSGAVVWEYHNPRFAGPDDAFVAAIFEMIRYPAATVMPWLRRR